jgi:3D (Asp-Asp-Asp) domain-containing protein
MTTCLSNADSAKAACALIFQSLLIAFFSVWPLIGGAAELSQADFSLPPPEEHNQTTIELWATRYYEYPASERVQGLPLRDRDGKPLTGNLAPKDWCLGAIEGTFRILAAHGPQVFSYAGQLPKSQIDCTAENGSATTGRSYFTVAKGPYGDGVASFILVPFRTIAVDKSKIPYGTVIYVDRARGTSVTLPDGTRVVHDGYFFAADKGSRIQRTHIDVFCGTMITNCFPSFISSNEDQPFKAVIVSDPATRSKLVALHTLPLGADSR